MSDRRPSTPLPAAAGAATEAPFEAPEVSPPEQFDRGTGSLRVRAARGILINSAFRVGLSVLVLARNVAIAAFLAPEEFGLWALILVTVMTLGFLKQIGVSSKYLQQNDRDQELAFQRAFTVDLCYTLALFALIVAAIPIYAAIYGRPEIIVPALVLSTTLIALVFQAPIWIFYRRMQYFRQRCLEAIDPVLSTAVMITLAALGLGYWSLVIGAVAGVVASATAAIAFSPYPLRLRADRRVLREYVGFSWPVLISGISGMLVIQGTLIVGNAALGLAALGAIGLATNFARFSNRIEQLINRTLYPPICAAQDRLGVLREVFEKSNRLGLMWAMPFGIGLALFAPDLVQFVLGPEWGEVEALLQVAGLIFAVNVFGFSWMSFYMARGETRPLAILGLAQLAAFAALTMPLMIVVGLDGYMIGIGIGALVQLALRTRYLRRLFPGFSMISHMRRALTPVLPAVGLVVVVRLLEGERTLALGLGELGAYLLIVTVATYLAERRLIGEALGYLRKAARRGPVAGGAGAAA